MYAQKNRAVSVFLIRGFVRRAAKTMSLPEAFFIIIMGTVCEWGGEAFLNQNNDEIRRTITLKPKMQQTG